MTRRIYRGVAAAGLAALAVACNNDTPSSPRDADVSFAKTPPGTFGCVFTGNPSLSNASNAYFTVSADQKAASDIIAQMQAGFTASSFAGARDKGFDLLSLIGKVSRAGTGSSATAGASAVQQTVQCMFDVNAGLSDDFNGWPTDSFNFTAALTASTGGASFVRGGPADSSKYPVVAHGTSGNISALSPDSGQAWTTILSNRVYIYGNAVDGGYDWKLIPRGTTFNPSAVVALCQGTLPAGEFFDTDVMVRQDNVGVLGFVGPKADTLCGTPASVATLGGIRGTFALLGRLAAAWLKPAPVYAATALATTSVGGRASGAKGDEFTGLSVPNVTLKFSSPGVQPPVTVKVNTRFSLQVNVATLAGEPAGGITVTLGTMTNNGTGTAIYQVLAGAPPNISCDTTRTYIQKVPSATTRATVGVGGASTPTNAVWNNNLCFSKTGSLKVSAASKADGRSGGIGAALSNKSTVNP